MGITHSWNGTVLTITSDSGTSSADLKGDIGVRGPQGAQGEQYKPQAGIDYLNEHEVNELIKTVVESLPGAAPSGYGLGLEMPNQINDCNNAKETGFYRYTAGAANAPSASGEWLETISYSSTYKYQRAFVSYTGGNIAERWMKGGAWQPWGWVNPPMEAGVEYRTTEWHNGKAVYTKRINFGSMPNNTQRSSPVVDEAVDVVSLQGIASSNIEVNQFPVVFSTGLVAYAYTQKSSDSVSAFVRTFTDMSSYTAQFTVKYTK